MPTNFIFSLDGKEQKVSDIRNSSASLANAIEEVSTLNLGNKKYKENLDLLASVLKVKIAKGMKKDAELVIISSDEYGELQRIVTTADFIISLSEMTLPTTTRRERVKGEKKQDKKEVALEDLL